LLLRAVLLVKRSTLLKRSCCTTTTTHKHTHGASRWRLLARVQRAWRGVSGQKLMSEREKGRETEARCSRCCWTIRLQDVLEKLTFFSMGCGLSKRTWFTVFLVFLVFRFCFPQDCPSPCSAWRERERVLEVTFSQRRNKYF